MNGFAMNGVDCPACSAPAHRPYPGQIGVYVCASCGCVHGNTYLGDSYSIVKPAFETLPDSMVEAKPFDLMCLGSKGIERRHGFFNPATRLITQVG